MSDNKTVTVSYTSPFSWLFAIATAIIGHEIHGSIFWSIVDFLFWPFAWIKWLVCSEVNISIIKNAFSFFMN
jgi:hypothetical protein